MGRLPPGTGTKGEFFFKFPTLATARHFVGRVDNLPDVEGTIGYLLDPETGESHKVAISRNEKTCVFDDAHDPGRGHRPRKPAFALWGTRVPVETDTGESGSGGYGGYVEGDGEVEE